MPRRQDEVPDDQGRSAETFERTRWVNGRRGELGLERVALTRRTGLYLPANLSMEAWQRIGRQLFVISDSSAWWWGDWLVFGEKRYADRYQRAIKETSLDYQTLRNYAWVARRFPVVRRREALSFQHHAVVAALPEAEQDELLSQAEKHGWTRNELRRRLRQQRHTTSVPSEPEVVYHLNVDRDRRIRWQEAATYIHEDFSAWIMKSLDRAADALLGDDNASTTPLPEPRPTGWDGEDDDPDQPTSR
jgi:hypothetical protein